MATVLAPSRTDRAFERLYRRYAADVYRYVLAVLQNAPDAEDATQTAFLSAYRAYERGERPERPLNWLIAIAHNVCRQRFRESARRPRLVELQDNDAVGVFDDETPNADDIKRALGFLAFNQRAALVMRELQGHSYEEIGRILGLSTSAVETLLFRARRAMREQLEGGLTCGEAELALSKRADGRLSFSERGRLRAHLRECSECAALDRRLRFRRRAIRSATLVPLPSSLSSIFGGGAATGVGMGAGMGAKAAAVVVAGVLGGGVAGDATKEREPVPNESAAAATGRSAALEQRPRANRIPSALRLSFERARAVRPSGVRRFSRTRPSTPSAAPANAGASAAPVGGSQAGPAAVSATAPDPRQAEESRAKAPADPNVPVAPTPVTPPAVGTVPEAPLEAPKVPEPPKLPELPKPPELANPGLPSVPHVPELPALPPTQIPESPGVQLPTTPTLSQP